MEQLSVSVRHPQQVVISWRAATLFLTMAGVLSPLMAGMLSYWTSSYAARSVSEYKLQALEADLGQAMAQIIVLKDGLRAMEVNMTGEWQKQATAILQTVEKNEVKRDERSNAMSNQILDLMIKMERLTGVRDKLADRVGGLTVQQQPMQLDRRE